MSKIELPTVTSGYNLSAINNNFQKIEDALNEGVLYRQDNPGEPNHMSTNLDMNGKRIINLPDAISLTEPATLRQLIEVDSGGATELRVDLASGEGASLIGISYGAISGTLYDLTTKVIPAIGVSPSNSYSENNAALNLLAAASSALKIPVMLPSGVILFDQIDLNGLDGAQFVGAGLTQTTLSQRVGANKNAITGVANEISIKNLGVDCNYFTSAWNSEAGALGNTSGNGLDITGFGHQIDILLNNVPEIGAIFRDPGPENSASRGALYDISIVGRDFGKEGLVIQGPNDGILRKAWIGRAGILPRPQAETTVAVSSLYPSEPVDGIVLDGVNIEIGDVHTYAAWSGTAFRTRGVCRLTKGGRIIAESSRAQVNTSETTYGSAFFDIRSLSLLHPNWTGTIPTYSFPSQEWDGATIKSGADFSCEITVKRTITQITRVVGSTAVHKQGAADVNVLTYSNSTAPAGDAEAGQRYSGDVLWVTSNGGSASVKGRDARGVLCYAVGEGCEITFSADGCSTALHRASPSNSKRGNNIRGSVRRCDVGFLSSGTPMSENVDISMELLAGQVAFSGDTPDMARAQNWRISASVDNSPLATLWRGQAALDASDTTAKTVVIPHKFLYIPGYQQVQISVDDRSTPSTAVLQYCVVNNITSSDITIAYKFSTADITSAANLRVNVQIQ